MDKKKVKDTRKERTREKIITAFGTLLREKSFMDIRVQDISESSRINRSTFYNHFVDKYELLEVVIRKNFQQRAIERVTQKLHYDEALVKNIYYTLIDFYTRWINVSMRNYHELDIKIERVLRQEVEILLTKALENSEEPLTDKEKKVIASNLSWLIFGVGHEWYIDGALSPEEYWSLSHKMLHEYSF